MMLGIDFGTSNSAAALVDGAGQLQVIALEQHNSSMPTALFFSPERGGVEYGTPALQSYLRAAQEQAVGGRLLRCSSAITCS